MKKKIILFGAVGLLAVGLIVGSLIAYNRWVSSPEYALDKIRIAVRNHDKRLFYKFVDVDSLVARGADALMSHAQQKNTSAEDLGELGRNIADGIVKMMKPQMIDLAKAEVDALIEATSLDEQTSSSRDKASPTTSTNPKKRLFGLGDLENPNIVDKTVEGKITLCTLKMRNQRYGFPLDIRLKFRETDEGHLQMAEIVNLDEILAKTKKAENAWMQKENTPFEERLNNALTMEELSLSKKSDRWGINKKVFLNLATKNITEKTISKWEGAIVLHGGEISEGALYPITAESVDQAPGAVKKITFRYEINQFIREHKILWEVDESKVSAFLTVDRVSFADGEILELPYPDL